MSKKKVYIIVLGIVLSTALGIALDSIFIGIGMVLGVTIGVIMYGRKDYKEKVTFLPIIVGRGIGAILDEIPMGIAIGATIGGIMDFIRHIVRMQNKKH